LRPPPIASATSRRAPLPRSHATSGAPPTSSSSPAAAAGAAETAHAAPAAPGSSRPLAIRSRPLRATVDVTLWSPDEVRDGVALPLLAVHDGPEYERQTGLTARAAELIRAGRVPPHRIALLDPGMRDEWYSASALYARALTGEVLPAVGRAVAVSGPPVGMGASLGGLAMLHAQRRSPDAFAALFLQSSSFFMPRFDHMEKHFGRYGRIVRFVRGVVRDQAFDAPVPATLTCAGEEDNVHNNRRVTAALKLQGYAATLVETPGGHDFATWGAALDPHLADLLAAAWSAG
jgi:enterochelin esterase-like enzyme